MSMLSDARAATSAGATMSRPIAISEITTRENAGFVGTPRLHFEDWRAFLRELREPAGSRRR
jgi:hypothetical protein